LKICRSVTFSNFFSKMMPLSDYVKKYGTARQVTDGNIIGRIHIALWITKATNTH
jgi:hypothetical protein